MFPRERDEVGQAHHRTVVVDDLADRAGRVAARHARQIDRGLGVAGAGQDAAFPRAQRKDVARPREIAGARVAVAAVAGERPDRARAVGGRDAGRRAVAVVDRHGERRPVLLGVVLHHLRQVELVEPQALHRRADHARRVAHEEGDRLGRRLVGGHDEVAFVLARFVVHDHHGPAFGDGPEGLVDRGEDAVRRSWGRSRRVKGGGRHAASRLSISSGQPVEMERRLQRLGVEHRPRAFLERQHPEAVEEEDAQTGHRGPRARASSGPSMPSMRSWTIRMSNAPGTRCVVASRPPQTGDTAWPLAQQGPGQIPPQHIVLRGQENPRHRPYCPSRPAAPRLRRAARPTGG